MLAGGLLASVSYRMIVSSATYRQASRSPDAASIARNWTLCEPLDVPR